MPLMQVLSNAELDARQQAEDEQSGVYRETFISSLASAIQKQWEINKTHKQEVERTMLQCLRQRNGQYSQEELSTIRQQGGSEVYMMLTAEKVRSAAAWIADIMMPADDRAWGIEATPVPELPPDIRTATIELLTQEVQEARAAGVEPPEAEIEERTLEFKRRMLEALQQEADQAAELAEDKIADQLVDSEFEKAMEAFIDDFCTFPAAILKTVYRRKKDLKWGQNGQPQVVEQVIEQDERVSPFDIYPSPGAVDIDDGNLIERCRYSAAELSALRGVPGYDTDAIEEVLLDHGDGFLSDWLSMWSHERDRLEHGNAANLYEETGLIDALVYNGTASGRDLIDWGMTREEVPDPSRYYEVEAILIGRHVIRAQLNRDPLGRRPYYKASYQNKPGSFWGISPPMLMKDIARICNATARSLMNNMGMASGPMGWIYTDRLPQGETVTGFHPWKIFQTISGNTTGAPMEFFQPQSNAAELIAVYNQFESKADSATGIPRYMFGKEGMPRGQMPAQTLAMILESMSKDLKDAIRHIDRGVIRPRVERQYQNNLLRNQNDGVRGDLKVVARGSTALIAKAATQARRNEFLAITNNPTDQMIMGIEGRADILRAMARDMDMGSVIPSNEEIQRNAAAQAPQQEQDPALQREQMRIQWEQQKLQQMFQENERERQVKLMLAQYGLKGDMMELAGRREISLEQIKAKLGETAMRERGNNERFVAEKQIKAQYGSGI